MAVNASAFVLKYPEWEGLEKAAVNLEKRNLRKEEREQQLLGRRQASATFLNNYLDPKDYLSGTDFDPMVVKGLQEAMTQGASLASQGVDSATLIMALAPTVSKISEYSQRAKTINSKVDDTIANMKKSGYEGYDYAKLKQTALKNAFYKTDPKSGIQVLDPTQADPSQDWVSKAIDNSPEEVTTAGDLDLFAKQSPMQSNTRGASVYSPTGKLDQTKVKLTGQEWLVPDVDEQGATIGQVPRYEVATDGTDLQIHSFEKDGKRVNAPVRLLDEGTFDSMTQRSPGIADYIKGLVKENIKKTGKDIQMGSPEAKRLARAYAYDELNRRKQAGLEQIDVQGKPSAREVGLNVGSSPEYLQMLRDQSEARTQGRYDVTGGPGGGTGGKVNALQAIGNIMNNKEDYTNIEPVTVDGKKVIDVTATLPGGGLKKGRGEDDLYKSVYYNPKDRTMIVETKEPGARGETKTTLTEAEIGPFMNKIAEANGVPRPQVRKMLDDMGYKNGKFTKATTNPTLLKSLEQDTKAAPEVEKAFKQFEDKGSVSRLSKLIGTEIGDQKVKSIDTKWFGDNSFKIKLEDKDGNVTTKEFKTKKDVTDFLRGNKTPETKATPATPASAKKQSPKQGLLD